MQVCGHASVSKLFLTCKSTDNLLHISPPSVLRGRDIVCDYSEMVAVALHDVCIATICRRVAWSVFGHIFKNIMFSKKQLPVCFSFPAHPLSEATVQNFRSKIPLDRFT